MSESNLSPEKRVVRYRFESVGMLGQMFKHETDEEVNNLNGQPLVLYSDYESQARRIAELERMNAALLERQGPKHYKLVHEQFLAQLKERASPEPKEEPVAWISDESLRRLKDGGNSRGSVPVHSKPSGFSHIPLLIARGQQLETAERKPTALCTCMGFARHPQECAKCRQQLEMKDQWICACKLTDARQCASEQRITAATCACECHRL